MMELDRLRNAQHICLFGAGVSLTDCIAQLVLLLGRRPDFICDNAAEKWGKVIEGVPCISPDELLSHMETVAVVITVRRYEPVFAQLHQLGFASIYVACFDRSYDVVTNIQLLDPFCFDGVRSESIIDIKGKWALVTGATRGVGRQIAIEMASLGSNLILHGRCVKNLEEVVKTCSGTGVDVRTVCADFGIEPELQMMLDSLPRDYPPIDIVFNNAAISLYCGDDPFNIAADDYARHFSINTIAPIRICYSLLPRMIERRFGRIVNISSTIQKRPLEMPYACSKAALNKFVHDIAPELQGTGVMMSLACPGFVRTDMGGGDAPHPVESVIPGLLLGAVMDADVNGRWFVAQDFAGMDLSSAIGKARFYYSLKEG